MGDKLDHTLVNTNNMNHHHIDVKYNLYMNKPMGTTCPQEDVAITLYMSGTVVCADTSPPTQQNVEDFLG